MNRLMKCAYFALRNLLVVERLVLNFSATWIIHTSSILAIPIIWYVHFDRPVWLFVWTHWRDFKVFVKEFIETLRSRLKDLQCLSCAKTFKDRNTLKDHMRKKSHRGLNKDDRSFDKFYLINYLEMGKRWTQVCFATKSSQTVRIPGQRMSKRNEWPIFKWMGNFCWPGFCWPQQSLNYDLGPILN